MPFIGSMPGKMFFGIDKTRKRAVLFQGCAQTPVRVFYAGLEKYLTPQPSPVFLHNRHKKRFGLQAWTGLWKKRVPERQYTVCAGTQR
jgi:hypothetical protein